ncbi:hypothetical protein C8Q69DRAFT_443157 [Paecilomyces variotii]|uniref:Uncharacterized protein n=1 Tax=Byssochlamys spectabilis TaxID=264951 RepID=A0A443HY78_BYSSP|nr:hypothetical protein C8Q69DRAFT_443157 [Paecilomyces variotii]RWQ96743.1 hypothetical protein C8Q69DRAFT_443157 [Paecilomyces variotii]
MRAGIYALRPRMVVFGELGLDQLFWGPLAATSTVNAHGCQSAIKTLPKAWEELDQAVGHQRSPTFEDEPKLPYVDSQGICKGGSPLAGWLFFFPKVSGSKGMFGLSTTMNANPDRFKPER